MASPTYSMLYSLLIFSLAMGLATGIVPQTSDLDVDDQSIFLRHFWSTSDKHHYKISQDGEVAELVLDELAGMKCDILNESTPEREFLHLQRFQETSWRLGLP